MYDQKAMKYAIDAARNTSSSPSNFCTSIGTNLSKNGELLAEVRVEGQCQGNQPARGIQPLELALTLRHHTIELLIRLSALCVA
mmetsp:Transcript_23871/g.57562  ORF Transcript_23871/g.57562 Transcript_23871/m.57562 type:complete len:84 (-) Transcript_23871:646-897(-)